jgi:HAD superfamily hydrolase (TIGR01509 family)
MIKGAVFDFDGVLVDSHQVHKRAWRRFLQLVGKTVSEEDLQIVLDGRKREDILRHFLGDISPELIISYGHLKEQLFREGAGDVQTVDGLVGFLEDLEDSGLTMGVASSGSRSRVTFLLDRLDLTKHFQVVVTGDEVKKGKPDPAIFLAAARALEEDPAELLAFEDAVSGVQSAKSAGMKCIGVAQPNRAPILFHAGADEVVPDFRFLSYSKVQQMFFQ